MHLMSRCIGLNGTNNDTNGVMRQFDDFDDQICFSNMSAVLSEVASPNWNRQLVEHVEW